MDPSHLQRVLDEWEEERKRMLAALMQERFGNPPFSERFPTPAQRHAEEQRRKAHSKDETPTPPTLGS